MKKKFENLKEVKVKLEKEKENIDYKLMDQKSYDPAN